MKNAICFCLAAGMFLQSSGQAQSGADATRSGAKNEISSSLVAALPLQPRTDREPYQSTPTQQFVCNTGYTQKQCNEDVLVLRKALANYPLTQLGDWTWILVRSGDWKAVLLPRGLDPHSPAFTYYPKRETFIEEALVTIAAEVEYGPAGSSRLRDPPRTGSCALQRLERTERQPRGETSGREKNGLLSSNVEAKARIDE